MASPESKHVRATLVKDRPSTVSLDLQRQEWESRSLAAELPLNIAIEPVTANGVDAEWVRDATADPNKVFLFVHGGGFNSGSSKTHRDLGSRISTATGMAVLLVNYRLAPENPFPAALADVTAVYNWLIEQGWAAETIVIGGDSAGANVAVSSLLSLRASGDALPAAAVLISPWLDLTLSGESMITNAEIDPMTTREGLMAAVPLYVAGQDADDPLISPVFADLQGLPPMLIQVGGDEVLLSDATRFAEKAKAAGVSVHLEVWPEMWHTWHGWAVSLPEAQEAIETIGQYVKQKVG